MRHSARSLGIFFAPILIPKALSYYRSIRTASSQRGIPISPVPRNVQSALGLLAMISAIFLVKSLPLFRPDDVFTLTQSRLQIPVDVLFNRVAAARSNNTLTTQDQVLRAKFVNLESRLLYFQFGPTVMSECSFCSSDEPKSYLYYALTTLLWPHVVNLIALSMATSFNWTGRPGSQWRSTMTLAAAAIAGLDVYFLSAYNYQANARATRLADIDFFHWTFRSYRCIALAALDATLAWVLYLSSTNRAFAQLPAPAERVEDVGRRLRVVNSKLHALGIIKNTSSRDEELRDMVQSYWNHEVVFMGKAMEEREVVEGMNDALSNRIDIATMAKDADAYAKDVTTSLRIRSLGTEREVPQPDT